MFMREKTRELDDLITRSEKEQRKLVQFVLRDDASDLNMDTIRGVDVAYRKNIAFACAIEMKLPSLNVERKRTLKRNCEFPYIPGHFYLREAPIVLELLKMFEPTGTVLIDGNGILHPRRMGC